MLGLTERLMSTARVRGQEGVEELARSVVLKRSEVNQETLKSIERQVGIHGINLQNPEERKKLANVFSEKAVNLYMFMNGIRI